MTDVRTIEFSEIKEITAVVQWNALVPYQRNTLVPNGTATYFTLQDVPAGTSTSDGAYYAKVFSGGIKWMGAYDPLAIYSEYMAVSSGNIVYIVKEGESVVAGETPTTATAKWDVLVDGTNNDGTPNTLIVRDASGDGIELPITNGVLGSLDGTAGSLAFRMPTLVAGGVSALIGSAKNRNGLAEGMGGGAIANGMVQTWGYTTTSQYVRTQKAGNNLSPVPLTCDVDMGTIVSAVASASFAGCVNDNGDVFAMSCANSYGAAGQGFAGAGSPSIETDPRYIMRKVEMPVGLTGKVIEICIGGGGAYSTIGFETPIVRTDTGMVAGWGYGGYGVLGQGDTANQHSAVIIPFPEPISKISMGDNRYTHAMFLGQTSKKPYFTGYCHGGRKGDSNNATVNTPQIVDALTAPPWGGAGVIDMFAAGTGSNGQSTVLCDNGRVYHAGYDAHGTGSTGSTSAKAVWTVSTHSAADITELQCTANIYGASIFKHTDGSYTASGTGYANCSSTGTVTTAVPIVSDQFEGTLVDVITVANAGSYSNTICVDDEDMAYINGHGNGYPMGLRSATSFFKPAKMALPPNVGIPIDMAHVGYSSNGALAVHTQNGFVCTSGYGGHGQQGSGDSLAQYSFGKINFK